MTNNIQQGAQQADLFKLILTSRWRLGKPGKIQETQETTNANLDYYTK